jgi:hypothetical protein
MIISPDGRYHYWISFITTPPGGQSISGGHPVSTENPILTQNSMLAQIRSALLQQCDAPDGSKIVITAVSVLAAPSPQAAAGYTIIPPAAPNTGNPVKPPAHTQTTELDWGAQTVAEEIHGAITCAAHHAKQHPEHARAVIDTALRNLDDVERAWLVELFVLSDPRSQNMAELTDAGEDQFRGLLDALLDLLAAVLPPETPEEAARRERMHQRAHERGLCTCEHEPALEIAAEEIS